MAARRHVDEEDDENFEEITRATALKASKRHIVTKKSTKAVKPRALTAVADDDGDGDVDEDLGDLKAAAVPKGARIISDDEAKNLHDVVIYRPGRQDSGWTKMNGIEFHAGKEVKIPRSKTVSATIRQQMQLADGSIVSRGVETRIPMIELLQGNPSFCVNGVEPTPRKKMRARVPTDARTYKPYAIEWISRTETAVELEARWRGEEELRDRIGVDEFMINNDLMPFYEGKHEYLKGQVADDGNE